MRQPARQFSSVRELLTINTPVGRKHIEAWHSTQAGFGCSIMAPDANGRVRRTYIHRYKMPVPDDKGGYIRKDTTDYLGLVTAIGDEPAVALETAMRAVLNKREQLREQMSTGNRPRMTVGGAWAKYALSMATNSGKTHEKDISTYERHIQHLAERWLDEMTVADWEGLVATLKDGTLVVGKVKDKATGEWVDDIRGPLANSGLIAVLNVGSNLYGIAHRHKALRGFAQGENPAKEAKKQVGVATTRKTRIPLAKLGGAWRASDQLLPPHWRDLWRVAVLTGLRHGLLFHMRFSEIDWQQGTHLIDPRKPGTKRRARDIPANPEPIRLPLADVVLDILKVRREFAPDKNGPVWYSPGGRAKSGLMVDPRKSWVQLEDHIGVSFTPQDLRRTFSTLALVACDGRDVLAISLLMLHSGAGLAKATGLAPITVDYMDTDEAQAMMRRSANTTAAYVLELAAGAAAPADPKLPEELEAALGDE